MKLAIDDSTIIPKIVINNKWRLIAEKVYIGSQWIKIGYYEIFLTIDKFSPITLGESISIKVGIEHSLIA